MRCPSATARTTRVQECGVLVESDLLWRTGDRLPPPRPWHLYARRRPGRPRPLPAGRRRVRWQSSGSTAASSGTTDAAKRKGGALRVGFVGGGTAETLNPFLGVTPIDQCRIQNLYDPLVIMNADLSTQPGARARVDAQQELHGVGGQAPPGRHVPQRQDASAPTTSSTRSSRWPARRARRCPFVVGHQRCGELKAINKLTVRIPLKAPDADLAGNFIYYNTWIVPDGADGLQEAGRHGPVHVRVVHARAAERVRRRTRTTGSTGKPYVDTLKIVSIDDNTARLNALLSGQIDAMAQLPTQLAKAHAATGDITVLVAPSPQPMMFYMDTTKAPFNDPRVTLAMKLIADRKALVDGAISGYGTRRQRHRRQGPAVLRQLAAAARAGHRARPSRCSRPAGQAEPDGRALDVATIFPGFVEAATLFAQQAKAAGVTVKLKKVPSNSYYNPSLLVPEDAVRGDAVGDQLAQVLLPAGARRRRAVQRDALEVGDVERAALQGGRRAQQGRGAGLLEPGAEDPVRQGRLHQLDERRLGRRPRPRRCRASSRAPRAPSATIDFMDAWLG